MPSPIRRYAFRRNLPHIQFACPLFVSLSTYQRWELPPAVRDIVFETVLREHRTRLWMYAFVMPDHLHLLFSPWLDKFGERISLPEIMSGIKGASAHKINKLLRRRGCVWEEEYWDHGLRKTESIDAKVEYIAMNPVVAGLVNSPSDYKWLWINEERCE